MAGSDDGVYAISVAASMVSMEIQNLRVYERRGLLDEPDRTLGGHRVSAPGTVTVLRVVKAAQRLGFTLDDVTDAGDWPRPRSTLAP